MDKGSPQEWGHWKDPLGVNPLGICHYPTLEPIDPRTGSHQAKQLQGGSAIHPSAENWIKVLLSKVLPTRARPSFSHHQSIPSRSLHKPLSLISQRADRRNKKHSFTAVKTKIILQNVNHDEKAESYVLEKGTR